MRNDEGLQEIVFYHLLYIPNYSKRANRLKYKEKIHTKHLVMKKITNKLTLNFIPKLLAIDVMM